jgi:hypothetical protein
MSKMQQYMQVCPKTLPRTFMGLAQNPAAADQKVPRATPPLCRNRLDA